MKLLSLTTVGVRGLPDGTYAFTDPRTGAPLDVALVTGGPASGKTTLLEAIAAAKEAAGAYGEPPDPKRFRRAGAPETRIAARWALSKREQDEAGFAQAEQTVVWDVARGGSGVDAEPALRRLLARFSRASDRGKLEYFPADRRMTAGRSAAFRRPSEDALPRLRAARDADKYGCLADGLRAAALGQATSAAHVLSERGVALRQNVPDALRGYKDAVAAMVPHLRLHGFDLADGGGSRFQRRSVDEPLGLEHLADSELHGVLFALAFQYLGLNDSLVLVDEPELHIHAADRVRFLRAVVGLGRGNQIIVATGAAELVQAASPGQVIDLSTRCPKEAA